MAANDKPMFLLVSFVVSLHLVAISALTDTEILLKFKGSLSNASALTGWSGGNTPCTGGEASNWKGVICLHGSVWGLQLESMRLSGKIDVDTLANLKGLRTLSFANNSFDGALPEFKKLGLLRSLYLSSNRFSGEIPEDAFEGMSKIRKVHLANNEFTGAIPSSLATLPKLLDLKIQGNNFTGQLPDFKQKFDSFDASNNALEGPIPASLQKIDSSMFAGNKGLCGEPLEQCTAAPNPTPVSDSDSNSDSNRNSESWKPPVVLIVVVALMAALAIAGIIAAALIVYRRRRENTYSIEPPPPSNLQKKTGLKELGQGAQGSPDLSARGKKSDPTKLSFVRDDRERYDLHDLLKASAEILGSGCFGSSYKAALSTGQVMVVKRYKQMNNVGKEEFQEHMRRIGRLSHQNMLPLVAYYYRKEEKLLITDFVHRGSLAVHLHGNQALGQPSLDWPTRLKIVKGVASGLAYLYKELPTLIAPHGHLKSSNVLLSESYEPILSDYALVPVINQENAQELMVAYKSPEYIQHGRITKKTDVWSLGMLILEILTGKFPTIFVQQGNNNKGGEEDLPTWVNSVPPQRWMDELFDEAIRGDANKKNEDEMVKLLKIGLSCCEGDVDKRLDLKEVVERVEELKEKDGGGDDCHSSRNSEADVKSSRGKSDDDVALSI